MKFGHELGEKKQQCSGITREKNNFWSYQWPWRNIGGALTPNDASRYCHFGNKYSHLLLNSPLIGNAKNILIIGKQMISLLLGSKLNVDHIIVSSKAAELWLKQYSWMHVLEYFGLWLNALINCTESGYLN